MLVTVQAAVRQKGHIMVNDQAIQALQDHERVTVVVGANDDHILPQIGISVPGSLRTYTVRGACGRCAAVEARMPGLWDTLKEAHASYAEMAVGLCGSVLAYWKQTGVMCTATLSGAEIKAWVEVANAQEAETQRFIVGLHETTERLLRGCREKV